MDEFIQGLALGFGAAVPIGPINILIMSYALKSYTHAFAFGFGAMSADIFYLVMLRLGVLKFLDTPLMSTILALFGAFFLGYISYMIFKGAGAKFRLNESVKLKPKFAVFLNGFVLTIANPYTVAFWISVSTLTIGDGGLFVVCGLAAAIFSWITLMPLFIYKNRHIISENMARIFAYICSAVLLFFAVTLIYNTFFKG